MMGRGSRKRAPRLQVVIITALRWDQRESYGAAPFYYGK